MATRDYFAVFGSGAPSTKSGLAPTFITFITTTGANGTPPSISEPGSKGIYKFSYDASATLITFVLDGATTGLATADRYIVGVLDPQDTFGVTLNAIGLSLIGFANTSIALGTTAVALGTTSVALGTTSVALGTTNIAFGTTNVAIGTTLMGLFGTPSSAIGFTNVNPVDIFGFLRRAQEFQEGNQNYAKATGILQYTSRGNTMIAQKTISDTATQTTRT